MTDQAMAGKLRPGTPLDAGESAGARAARTWWRDAWDALLAQKSAVAGGIILLALALLALLAPWIAPYDPIHQYREIGLSALGQPLPPNAEFWLGTDGLGRDLLSRLMYGGRVSLGIGLGASVLAVLIALAVGGFAGFMGGSVDFWLMRLVDLVMSMPTFFVMLLLVVMLEPGAWVVLVVISAFAWTYPARIFRSQILTVKEKEYVLAARAIGVPGRRIFIRHLLPHVLPLLIVYLALGIPTTIFAEASLSFLGLGVPPPTPSWGSMIQDGMSYYRAAPWVAIFPGLAIMLAVVSFNLFGTGLRDAMDPKQRGR